MQYTWDPAKAKSNVEKHGVSFEEAIGSIEDPNNRVADDNASGEPRLIVLGMSRAARLLFVVCIEVTDHEIRIISARKATQGEARSYAEG